MKTPPRFSIAVLTRNEARALPRLLQSLGSFTDRGGEVLILDTGSTDDTISIARAGRCRVEIATGRFESTLDAAARDTIDQRFALAGEGPLVEAGQRLFHFGDARQYTGLLAASNFVLQLDASDQLLALDVDALDRYLSSGPIRTFAYDLLTGNVRLRISRFYDRTRYRWDGRVHEILKETGGEGPSPPPAIRCDPAELLIRHHKDEGKERHYLAGLALQALERPREPRWWHYVGRELFYQHRYRSAIAVLEAHAAMEAAWPAERSQSLCFAAECLEALGQRDEARQACRRAVTLDSTRREPLLRLAALHSQQGEFEAAATRAELALAIPRTSAYPELEANYTWVPHSLLYWSLFWLGRKNEAREHWEICRALAPDDAVIREHARLFLSQRATGRIPASSSAPRSAAPIGADRTCGPC